jgi:chemotaxis protein methyltransferase CheR
MAFTFFFRDYTVIETAVKLMLAETMGRCRVRVWDAGCAMGPEPYTLLICLAENMGHFAFENLQVDATDHDEGGDFGGIIERGLYPAAQVNRIPAALLEKYFQPINELKEVYEVDSKLRSKLNFKRHDLLSLIPLGQGYSMIVCKNVLLHFPEEQRIKVISMYHNALSPGGLLVMEHTQKLPEKLKESFCQATIEAQIYRKIDFKSIAA